MPDGKCRRGLGESARLLCLENSTDGKQRHEKKQIGFQKGCGFHVHLSGGQYPEQLNFAQTLTRNIAHSDINYLIGGARLL